MPHRKSVILALAVLTALLAGVLQVSASPECPVPQVSPAPESPEGIEPVVLPFDEPEPIFMDCIGECIAARQECYSWCGTGCGICETAFTNCLSTCSP